MHGQGFPHQGRTSLQGFLFLRGAGGPGPYDGKVAGREGPLDAVGLRENAPGCSHGHGACAWNTRRSSLQKVSLDIFGTSGLGMTQNPSTRHGVQSPRASHGWGDWRFTFANFVGCIGGLLREKVHGGLYWQKGLGHRSQ